jgi:hypothetical protein
MTRLHIGIEAAYSSVCRKQDYDVWANLHWVELRSGALQHSKFCVVVWDVLAMLTMLHSCGQRQIRFIHQPTHIGHVWCDIDYMYYPLSMVWAHMCGSLCAHWQMSLGHV